MDGLPVEQLVPMTKACLVSAASSYQIHPDVMYALLIVEGGTVGSSSKENSNRTKDHNLFQINDINIPELEQLGITRVEIENDGCLNAFIAARHLRRALVGAPEIHNFDDYLKAIARYHNTEKTANEIYAEKLKKAFECIYSHEYTFSFNYDVK
jgi:hypothetical protein